MWLEIVKEIDRLIKWTIFAITIITISYMVIIIGMAIIFLLWEQSYWYISLGATLTVMWFLTTSETIYEITNLFEQRHSALFRWERERRRYGKS